MYITPRTLLGIIRISQSLAKFNFRDEVTQNDVDHAIRLMDYSLKTLEKATAEAKGEQKKRKYYNKTNYFIGY